MERKSQHFSLVFMGVLFLALVGLTFWHTSLSFGEFRPDPVVGLVLWGVFTLVVLGVLGLGFVLFRNLLKLYVERRQGRLGSKIKTKLVAGALILSIVPVIAMVTFSFSVMSRTYNTWFDFPTREILAHSERVTEELNEVMRKRIEADALWIASLPDIHDQGRLEELAGRVLADYVAVLPQDGAEPLVEARSGNLVEGAVVWRLPAPDIAGLQSGIQHDYVWASAPVGDTAVLVAWKIPADIQKDRAYMARNYERYASLEGQRRDIKYANFGMMLLITVFVLFVAVWLSLYLSRQISVPIEALVDATAEVSSGRLGHRIQTRGIDEIGDLVDSFNGMTQRLEEQTHALRESNRDLEAANAEIDSRRRFTNAILESITPGVVSINADGEILKANSAVNAIFGKEADEIPGRIEHLFSGDDLAELHYMLNRASRTGLATREFEIQTRGKILHLAVTVSALETSADAPARYAVVFEDMSELLRAQKSAAWNEVARRVAHEIKNPLTSIALSAQRMQRLLDRWDSTSDEAERATLRARFEASAKTIGAEVDSLRRLVDEFAQFARFPKAEPERNDLSKVAQDALAVFEGRMGDVGVRADLAADLPAVMIDGEQFKRVVINLVDNAAEALGESWVKEILVSTVPGSAPETVELSVSDSGPGISPEDKEKLFLPYFSTKNRGTGLGLAIVSRIVNEHGATIRVEDNRPVGTRFIIEIPTVEVANELLAGAAS